MKLLPTLILLAGLFCLSAILPQAQTAPTFVPCGTGGVLFYVPTPKGVSLRCVDPASLAGPAGLQGPAGVAGPQGPQGPQGAAGATATGGPCTAPAAGVTMYAQLPDGTCLPLTAVPAPGGIASLVTAESGVIAMNGQPERQIQYLYTNVTPVP